MATGVVSNRVSSHILHNNKGNIREVECNKCRDYESQLKEALDELVSVRAIIDILQKEQLPSSTTMCNQNNYTEEEFIKTNLRRTKKSPLKCGSGDVLMRQLQPIPVIMNRYAPLANLQEVTEASHNLNTTNKVTPTRNLKKWCAKSKKKRK